MKIILCFGTRPEAIKMAPLVHEFKKRKFNFKICITGQHREMLDQVLDFFEITPDYDLRLMQKEQSLNTLASKIFSNFDEILLKEKPDLMLVHGDTTTSSMAALAAFHQQIKVGHVEAGLRTYNKHSPFPEEVNRQLTGRIAEYHFAPTKKAADNLVQEGVSDTNIIVTGNTIVDALLFGIKKTSSGSNLLKSYFKDKIIDSKKIVLITGHRRENFGQAFESICNAVVKLSKRDDVQIIWPVHLNPKVKVPVEKMLKEVPNVLLLEPLSYPYFIWLMLQSSLIISDSGGIQEEAATIKKPVIVTRETSERMEGVESGFSFLTGTSEDKIITIAEKLLNQPPVFKNNNPYGDGDAAKQICIFLENLNFERK